MRRVTRVCSTANTPSKLLQATTLAAWETIATTGNTSLISSSVYRDSYNGKDGEGKNSRVVDKLNEWYYGKCAYCERIYKLDVDHYRPKGAVWDENGNVIRGTGYYWLGYEWSNLIPACITCNREGGKMAKFPFMPGGNQVVTPTFNIDGTLNKTFCNVHHADLIAELPTLLNPEVDDNFENYFSFTLDSDMQGIRISGADVNGRGTTTIKLCNLNKGEIRRDRVQSVIKGFVNSIAATIKLLESGRINAVQFKISIESHIQKICDDRKDIELDHTLLRKFIVATPQNFNTIVVPFVNKNFQSIIQSAFLNYTPI